MFNSITKLIQEFANYIFKLVQQIADLIIKPINIIGTAQNELLSQFFSLITGRNSGLEKLNESIEQTNKSIEDKIEEAQQALITTSKVINELNELIDINQKELKRVKSEYEHINELNEISLDQAKPLLKELDSTIKQDSKKNLWISIAVSFIFFLAGAILGPIIYDVFISYFKI